jgi:hypothetical protein
MSLDLEAADFFSPDTEDSPSRLAFQKASRLIFLRKNDEPSQSEIP